MIFLVKVLTLTIKNDRVKINGSKFLTYDNYNFDEGIYVFTFKVQDYMPDDGYEIIVIQ